MAGCNLGWQEQVSVWAIRAQHWFARVFGPLLRPGVFWAGVIGVIYAVATILKTNKVPNEGYWKGLRPLNSIFIGTGVLTLVFGYLIVTGYRRTLAKRGSEDDLNDSCRGAWHLAVRRLSIDRDDMDKVAAHVWIIRGIKGAKFLERRAKFTLQRRKATRVYWRKGTGAIGIAWELNQPITANVEYLDQIAPDEEAFCALERKERYGLTWDEFQKAKHYRSILAIPLETRPGHVAGCLSIDVKLDGYAAGLRKLSGEEQLGRIRDVCEQALGAKN